MSTSQWICLIMLSVLWGGSFFSIGIAVPHIPPLTLVLSRVALAALCLLPLVLILKLRLPASLAEWRKFAVMAILSNIIPFSMIALGQTQISSGLASVINATTPFWSVLIVHMLTIDDKLTKNKTVGVVLGVIGVAVLMGPDAILGATSSIFGMACIIAATISYGFSTWWSRNFTTTHPLVSAACQLTCATLMLFPIALTVDQSWRLPWPPAHVVWAVASLAVLSTAVANIIFFYIISVSGPTKAVLVTLLVPVSGIFLGTLFLEEKLAPLHIAGTLIIMIALIIFNRTPRQAP